MNSQADTERNAVDAALSSATAEVRDGFGETPASNEPAIATQRLRALDVLTQCMLAAGLGA
jgi:hypothetical protein